MKGVYDKITLSWRKMEDTKPKVLVTGVAGFIGFHFAKRLLSEGYQVIGVDNLNDYYPVSLKISRLKELGFSTEQLNAIQPGDVIHSEQKTAKLSFFYLDLKEREKLEQVFKSENPYYVVNLAAQAGVRYSLKNPYAYIDSNIVGFMNILENCRNYDIKHLVYASSSSVYGANEQTPFSVHHHVDHPISLYAATKKSNELMAHTYSHLYNIPTTGLRFFTVYGPWGRPDMAYFIFARKILESTPIDVYNHGQMRRDFTYIDDIVEGIYKVLLHTPEGNNQWDGMHPDPASSKAPFKVFNIGNNNPIELSYFIKLIEKNLGKEAEKNYLPLQQGDLKETCANIDDLHSYIGFSPSTSIEEGMKNFIQWYLEYKGSFDLN
jgi:UDP-glucuronate 4-epimerase